MRVLMQLTQLLLCLLLLISNNVSFSQAIEVISSSSKSDVTTLVIPSSVTSLPLSKSLAVSSSVSSYHHQHDRHYGRRLHRRHHRHHSRGHSSHAKARAFGSLFATYLATVYIDDEPYVCILDTGSSDFAVAASPACGCDIYYRGDCDDNGVQLSVRYGDGNWTGVTCKDEVRIGKLSLGQIVFAGMKSEIEMLECDHSGHQQNGIIGLAFPGLLGPPTNYTLPFMDLLSLNTNLPSIFALQCCGWQNKSGLEYNEEYAQGSLDLGGANHRHYQGDIYWTPITERLFYAVDLVDVRVNDISTMPAYRRAADARYEAADTADPSEEGQTAKEAALRWPEISFAPQTIVDSGTSNIIFTQELWNRTVNAIKAFVPPQPDTVWSGDDCIAHSNDGSDITATWPTLTIVLAPLADESHPIVLKIPPCRYLAKAPASECSNGIDGHSFTVELEEDESEGWILGQVLYESFYIIHDNENNRVGFGLLDGCQADNTCVKEATIGWDTLLKRAPIQGELGDDQGHNIINADDNDRLQISANDAKAVSSEHAPNVASGQWMNITLIISLIGLFIWCYYWQHLKHRQEGYEPLNHNDSEEEL